jgi:hypothetical protein
MKMNQKEKVKYFNQIFLMLKNKIPADSMPAKKVFIVYYSKYLHHTIAYFKITLKPYIIINILIVLAVKIIQKTKINVHLMQTKMQHPNKRNKMKHQRFFLSLI